MDDVAKEAGVTKALVSRVLNRDDTLAIKPETRQNILEAVKKLNYTPNALARSLRLQSTGLVGFVVPNIGNPFFNPVINGVDDILSKERFMSIICNTNESSKTEEEFVKLLYDRQVDGIILATAEDDDAAIRFLEDCRINYVLVTRDSTQSTAPYVGLNTYQGISLATEHVISLGHTRIAHLAGNLRTVAGVQALQAFKDKMSEYRIRVPSDFVIETDYFEDVTYNAVREILSRPDRPTAFVACTDYVATSAISAINSLGLDIPGDVSITGYNNSWVTPLLNPKLTTVDTPLEELGRRAAQILIDMIFDRPIASQRVILDTELIVRESTTFLTH